MAEECSEGGAVVAATVAAAVVAATVAAGASAEFNAVPPKLDSKLNEGAMLLVGAAMPLP